MEDDQQFHEFKAPQEFKTELDNLEKYKNEPTNGSNLARMSLFRVFDPLVGSEAKSPAHHLNSTVQNDMSPVPVLNNGVGIKQELEVSTTLIHINTPSSKQHRFDVENANAALENESTKGNTNGHYIMDETIEMNENFKHETDSLNMELLNELTLINEQIIYLAEDQLEAAHQQHIDQQKKEERFNVEKDNIIEELNRVEKNYFDTHSRYENMRTIVKQLEARDAANKEKVFELTNKLKEKDQECRKLKQTAETQKYVFIFLLCLY